MRWKRKKATASETVEIDGHELELHAKAELGEDGRSVWELRVDDPSRVFIEAIGKPMVDLYQSVGGRNYVEMSIWTPECGALTLIIQRKEGKTPHQLRQEAEAERDVALAEVERLRGLLEARG